MAWELGKINFKVKGNLLENEENFSKLREIFMINTTQWRRVHLLTTCTVAPLGTPKMFNKVQKGVYPLVFGCSYQLLLNKYLIQGAVLLKITRRTTTSERKQVFASKSKFQIESVKIEPTFALMQDILTRRLGFLNS